MRDVDGTAANAIESISAGAAIIHHHHDFRLGKEDSITEFINLGEKILSVHPEAILYPDFIASADFSEKISHFAPLAAAGTIGLLPVDAGAVAFAGYDDEGLPTQANRFGASFTEAQEAVTVAHKLGLPVTIGVYEPGNLRFALAYARAGKLPAGSMVKLYFAGEYSIYEVGKKALNFGLPPTKPALDAYLDMLEGTDIAWNVGVMGGLTLETPIARYALEKGGHIRVGTEDAAELTEATDAELVAEVVELAAEVGRPVAVGDAARAAIGAPIPTRA
ncbi:3-keto-5-aminohexanoate cleavage protein [Microbacterium sp. NPDC077644]|uniref:3-keto-5-aminohexanoate cleavage protein n=1 Tax=Microbacterium sp. NPDC077644 TaxID=3155055 RepID=UPI00344D2408